MNFVWAFLMLYTTSILCQVQKKLSKDNNQFSFQTLNVDNGLSQNSVISIAQDSTGYLWFATQDGLNRYDGIKFKYYDKHFEDVTRTTYSRLGKIFVDKDENIWIISLNGKLEKYDSESESFINIKGFENVSKIYQDSYLNNYIGTYDGLLYKIDNKSKDTLKLIDLNTKTSIYDIVEKDNYIYVAGSEILYKISTSSNQDITTFKDNKVFSCLAISNNKKLFVGTYGDGLFYLDENNDDSLRPLTGFNNDYLPKNLNIQDLLFDTNGRLWIATYGNGLYLLDFESQSVEHFSPKKYNPHSISYNDILCLYQDISGTIWVGTDGGGVSYFDEHLFKFNVITNNRVPEGININVIRSIAVDNINNIWLGTSGEGLTKYNKATNEYKTYTNENSALASNRIMSLKYIKGNLYIGHQGTGLQIMDERGNFKNFDSGSNQILRKETIWNIFEDEKNRIWLGTRNSGLIQFNSEKGIVEQFNTNTQPSIVSNNIRAIEKGPGDTLFIGADDGGLSSLNLLTDETKDIKEINEKIKSLYFDGNGTLWIGTNGNGLISYNLETSNKKIYTTGNGLSNNVIYGVLPDDSGNLWLSSNRGLTNLNVETSEIINYSNYDGLQASEFNTGAYFRDANGILYFGGIEGLNWFKPQNLTNNTSIPKTVITNFEVFTEEHPLTQNQELNYKQHTVTFTFAGLHYSQPDRNQYMYKLENHDSDWHHVGNTNTAHYTNLPSGDYTFKVKSSNYDGYWNETPSSLSFTIKKPWYLSVAALILYSLVVLFAIYFIYHYFKWRWQMKMRYNLERHEAERLKKLNDFKTRLYTNISHEFRTPLTLISGPIEQQLERSNLSERDKKDLKLVKRNSNRLLKLVDQLLDLSKIESGNLELSVAEGDLTLLINQLTESFKFKANQKNIKLNLNIESIKNVWFDRDVIEKIVTNLLANAVKYTPNDGYIRFDATQKDGQLILTVLNNGNDLSGEELSNLFKRYFQRQTNSDGVGIGLSLVKELVALTHGNIVVSALNADDIQFTVTLPIAKSFFNNNEIKEPLINNKAIREEPIRESVSDHNSEKLVLQIVEDNKEVRDYIVSIFSKEFEILISANGEEGLKQAIDHIPDIIISDVMMPIKDGIELCSTLKSDHRTDHIPIILLTAKSGLENELAGIDTGADAYITKPFNHTQLKLRVKKLIENRQILQRHFTGEVSKKNVSLNPRDQKFMEQLNTILEKNINNPEFNADQLSFDLLMSRMQLHRKLKAITGVSTSEYIRKERLKRAASLLKNNELTVSEVAYEVGFNTPSYFIRSFKKIYQLTPREYITKFTKF